MGTVENSRQTRSEQLMDMADLETGWIPPIECGSSFIQSIAYNIRTNILLVGIQFKGQKYPTAYPYFDYNFNMFVHFVNSDSKGVFYNDWVKSNRYRRESIYEPETA